MLMLLSLDDYGLYYERQVIIVILFSSEWVFFILEPKNTKIHLYSGV